MLLIPHGSPLPQICLLRQATMMDGWQVCVCVCVVVMDYGKPSGWYQTKDSTTAQHLNSPNSTNSEL